MASKQKGTRKQKKTAIYDRVVIAGKDAESMVFVAYNHLTVANAQEMRKKLRVSQVGYIVSKKTLIRKALESKKIEGMFPELPGQVAMAYGKDALAPAREVFAFQTQFAKEKKLTILGGVFQGKFVSQSEMMALAVIPSRETLLGMFVNVINSPIQGLAVALDAIAKTKTA